MILPSGTNFKLLVPSCRDHIPVSCLLIILHMSGMDYIISFVKKGWWSEDWNLNQHFYLVWSLVWQVEFWVLPNYIDTYCRIDFILNPLRWWGINKCSTIEWFFYVKGVQPSSVETCDIFCCRYIMMVMHVTMNHDDVDQMHSHCYLPFFVLNETSVLEVF